MKLKKLIKRIFKKKTKICGKCVHCVPNSEIWKLSKGCKLFPRKRRYIDYKYESINPRGSRKCKHFKLKK